MDGPGREPYGPVHAATMVPPASLPIAGEIRCSSTGWSTNRLAMRFLWHPRYRRGDSSALPRPDRSHSAHPLAYLFEVLPFMLKDAA